MSQLNSYAEYIRGTYAALLVDCAAQYPALTKEFRRDQKRLSSALDCHGIRFALETMPAFGKHLDKCVSEGRLTHSGLLHFGAGKAGGTIPRLFRGLVLRVFESNGKLKLEPDANALRLLRQLLRVARRFRLEAALKARCEASEEFFRTDLSVRSGDLNWDDTPAFIATDAEKLSFSDGHLPPGVVRGQKEMFPDVTPESSLPLRLLEKVQQVADLISSQLGVFHPTDWKLKHGPGAVSDLPFGSYRYSFQAWPDRLDRVFPYEEFAVANYSHVDTRSSAACNHRRFLNEAPARLLAVPKTIATPRLIAAEPHYLQWCQHAISRYMYTRVSSTVVGNFVDFHRQDLNGDLARVASLEKEHATIDLSSASDRVSCWHVERLFRRLPCLLDALQATRSVWIQQEISQRAPKFARIRKFSTMGNATIFPVQSLFFLALALGTVCYRRNLRVTLKSLRSLGKQQVRVFGDDIIVPIDCAGLLLELLQHLQLKVNTHKTFTVGNFRESCGVEAFLGQDVTSVSLLDAPDRARPGTIVSSVDVQHNLCSAGYWNTASYVRKIAGRAVAEKLRYVKHGSGLFGWSDLFGGDNSHLRVRWNPRLHRQEHYCLRQSVKEVRASPEDGSGLLQYFTEALDEKPSERISLGYLTRRPQSKLRLGWAAGW